MPLAMTSNNWMVALVVIAVTATAGQDLAYAGTLHKVRPLVLKVTDRETRKPLQGIVVHYVLTRRTVRTSTLGVLPPIEPVVEDRIVSSMTAHSDAKGEVKFEGVEVYLRRYFIRPREDKIHSETLFINLEPSDEVEKFRLFEGDRNNRYELLYSTLPELQLVVNPNEKYKGYVLSTVNYIDRAHGREQEKASVDFRPEDFSSQAIAYFTVELRRH